MAWNFGIRNMYKPSDRDREKNRIFHNKCRYFGIKTGVFGDSRGLHYTEDELLAIQYLWAEKPLPKDLEERLLATKEERLSRFPKSSGPVIDASLLDEELERILNGEDTF